MCPSDKRPCCRKKREKKRRLDNATSKIQSFFVTTTPSEAGRRNQQRRNQHHVDRVVQELDLTLNNPTERTLFQLSTLPNGLKSAILHHGPCRQKGPFAISSENGNRRLFSETHYHAHSVAMEIERQRIFLSPTMKNPSFQSCWLLGYPLAMQKVWVNGVSGKPKNFGVKIQSILHDALGHTCPSMVRYQLINMFVFIPSQ